MKVKRLKLFIMKILTIGYFLFNVNIIIILVTNIYIHSSFALTELGPLVEPMVWGYRSDLTGYYPAGRVL